jgi:hypothetical protein
MNPELSRRLGRVWNELLIAMDPAYLYGIALKISKSDSFDDLPNKLKKEVLSIESKNLR